MLFELEADKLPFIDDPTNQYHSKQTEFGTVDACQQPIEAGPATRPIGNWRSSSPTTYWAANSWPVHATTTVSSEALQLLLQAAGDGERKRAADGPTAFDQPIP